MRHFDIRAAIIFIVAHFLTMAIYIVLAEGFFMIWQSGFVIHMSQALVFLGVASLNIAFKLRVASFVTSIFYCLIAINWLLFERGIEVGIQTYFYDHFQSIIMTMNLIVIYLLGKGGAIHIFNMLHKRPNFYNKVLLLFRSVNHNSVLNINAPISGKNFKSKEGCE
jgi:hypothetical protein